MAATGGEMAAGTEWGGHRAERVTEGDGAKGKEAGSGSGSTEGSAGGGWVREWRVAQVRREHAGQTDGAQMEGKSVGRRWCKSRRWSAGERSDGTGKGDMAWARDEGAREARRARG